VGQGQSFYSSVATLRSASGGKTRLQHLVEWCGPDFAGCILFNKAHAMGGVAGGEGRFGATKGIAGVELQNRLPRPHHDLRVSGRGHQCEQSRVRHAAWAVGEGIQFPNRQSFTLRIREGGIARPWT
jgi:hypothetical protein